MWKTPLYDTTKLTVELRELVENGVNIWDFDYPSYYEGNDKTDFEQKVIDHYYFRQIGQETVGRFLHMFRTRIREIMPRYIDMYHTVELMRSIDDPFGNVDIVETYEETSEGSASGSSSASSQSSAGVDKTDDKTSSENTDHKFSNTPQGSIDNIDRYMTEASKDKLNATENVTTSEAHETDSSSEATTEQSTSGTVSHTLTRKGNQGVNT